MPIIYTWAQHIGCVNKINPYMFSILVRILCSTRVDFEVKLRLSKGNFDQPYVP
nr:MAG TPA: hypothetical protein [Bacteriophage sp.]